MAPNTLTYTVGGIQGPPVPANAIVTFQTLTCVSQAYGPVDPYIWPALVWIDKSTFSVGVVAPPITEALVLLYNNILPGDAAAIPQSVGELIYQMDKPLANYALIPVIILWEKATKESDTPVNVVQAGFKAYVSTLQQAISHNLSELNSSDQSTRNQAFSAVQKAVSSGIYSAMDNALSDFQKLEIYFSFLILDSEINDASAIFNGPTLGSKSFTMSISEELPDSAGKALLKLYKIAGTLSLVPQPVALP